MLLSRRDIIGSLGGALTCPLFLSEAHATGNYVGAPREDGLGAKSLMFQAIENSSWVATPGYPEYPIYIIYAPWCPNCKMLISDFAAGKLQGNFQFRWIGAAAENERQRLSIAQSIRLNDFSVVYDQFFRGSTIFPSLPEEYVRRTLSSTVIFAMAKTQLYPGGFPFGFPLVIFVSGSNLIMKCGYRSPADLDTWQPTRRPEAWFLPATDDALAEPWKEGGPYPGGKFFAKYTDAVMYSLPYPFAVPFSSIPKGYGKAAKRIVNTRGIKWVEIQDAIQIGNAGYNGYIRL